MSSPTSFFSYHDSPVLAARLRPIREHVPWLNAFVNRAARYTTRSWSEPVLQLRRTLGIGTGADPIFEGQHSPLRVLALFSSCFAKPQPDWPRQVLTTGFPFWQQAAMPMEASSLIGSLGGIGAIAKEVFGQEGAARSSSPTHPAKTQDQG